MTLRVTFRRVARVEFIETAAWHGGQRLDLGADFIAEIERCVALAAAQPELYDVVHNGIRRVTAQRFPYSVYFRAEARRIVVVAVFHGSRDPATWQSRV